MIISFLCLQYRLMDVSCQGFFAQSAKNRPGTVVQGRCLTNCSGVHPATDLLGVAVQYAFVDGLTAMGQMRAALPISFFRKGLYVLCVLVLPHRRPIQDVFWSAALSDLVGACVTLLVFGLVIAPRLKREMATEIA